MLEKLAYGIFGFIAGMLIMQGVLADEIQPQPTSSCQMQVLTDNWGRAIGNVGLCRVANYKCIAFYTQTGSSMWCDGGPLAGGGNNGSN